MPLPTLYFTVMQGRMGDLSGQHLANVLIQAHQQSIDFLRSFPDSARFHHPAWRLTETDTVFDGWERYELLADHTLGPRVANWVTT